MTKATLATLGATALAMGATAQAATIGYWRFEGDNFLADSSGNGNTLTATSPAPDQAVNGAVASFGTTIPQTGATNANVVSMNLSTQNSNFSRAESADNFNVSSTGLTFETYFRKTANTSGTQYFASQNSATSSGRSWGIGVLGTSVSADNNKVFFVLSPTGAANTVFNTSFVISNDTDYYLAWTYVPSTGTAKVYLKQVGDELGSPQTISTGLTALNNSSVSLRIGAVGDSSGNPTGRFRGYLDEVRLSSGILPTSEFLAVPEPASAMLIGSAFALLGGRRRQRN